MIVSSDFNHWFRVADLAWPQLRAQKRPVLAQSRTTKTRQDQDGLLPLHALWRIRPARFHATLGQYLMCHVRARQLAD
jgi:predicted class III extradiol MEMO1 family dioxygenase